MTRQERIEEAARALRVCQVALDEWTGADADGFDEDAMGASWEAVERAESQARDALDRALALPHDKPAATPSERDRAIELAGAVWALAAPEREMDSKALLALVARFEGGAR